MNEYEFELKLERCELDDAYAEYIMDHTDAFIGNGDMLIKAMESGNYFDGFKEHLCDTIT